MTIAYKKIEILGHTEKRTCPVCSTCKRTFHPSQLPLGTIKEESWTCSVYCTFVNKHGQGALQRLLRPVEKVVEKLVEKPETAKAAETGKETLQFKDILEKYKSIPGASWADEE